jgi:hypothetical protein
MIRVPVLLALLGVAASQLRGGPTVDLRMSQQTAIKGKSPLTLTLMSVEDSRCPTGAQCLVPGTVKATIAYKPGPVNSKVAEQMVQVTLGEAATAVGSHEITLMDVNPKPSITAKFAPSAYVARVRVTVVTPSMGYQRALAKWKAAGSQSYTFVLEKNCRCMNRGPATVTVAKGVVTSGVDRSTGAALTADALATFPSIDAIFEQIRKALSQRAPSVQVTYDDKVGYPTSLYIDWSAAIADEETSYTLSAYTPLQ